MFIHTAMIFYMFIHTAMIFIQQRLYVYTYSNDIHNVATNVSLTQQLFALLFFLVQFKTLGSTLEPGLAIKLCSKALSSK